MPHKAQLVFKLAQLAQAAAKDGRQQVPLIPQVATNVWDTLQGTAPATQARQGSSVSEAGAISQGLSRLQLGGLQEDAATALLLHGLPGSNQQNARGAVSWGNKAEQRQQGPHPGLQGLGHPHWDAAADTSSYDTAGRQMLPAANLLLPHLSGAAAMDTLHSMYGMYPGALEAMQANFLAQQGSAAAGPHQEPSKAPGCARKARYNSSVTLNKQIMSACTTRDLLDLVYEKRSQFDFFNISSAIARVPKLMGSNGTNVVQLDSTAKILVDELAELMCKLMDTFDARGLANAAWAFGKLKYVPSQKLPAQIAAASVGKIRQFSAQNLSNMLWSFVYLHYRDEKLLSAAAEQVRLKVALFKPQELANVVWAFASQDHYDEALMEAVAARALTMIDQFKEQELSNVLWAFGKLKHYDKVLFLRMLGAVAVKLPHFLPQGVSNVAWALAAVGHKDPLLFDQLVGHCMADLSSYDVQGLSNLMWACASMGHKDLAFLDAVLQECTRRLDRLSTQNLSNILWSCATLGYADPHMLGMWAQATLNKLDSFEPQGLSNTAWAFAKLGYQQAQLFEEMAGAAIGRLEGFTAQGLSNTAWAFATAGHYHPLLFQQLAQQAVDKLGSFNMQNCSVTAWSFATMRHYDAQLFSAVLERVAGTLGFCEPQNIANTLWAYARMGHSLGRHQQALSNSALALMPRMQQQELCNTVWALGVLELLEPAVWERFCQCLASVEGITPEGVHQAFHAQLMMQSQLSRQTPGGLAGRQQQLPCLPEPLHSQARDMWLASAVDVHVSRLQQDVSSALSAAGIPHALEWLTDDGMFSIDIAFVVDGRPVALEVDGSHHFTNSVPQQPLSDVLIRQRLLRDRGWVVVNLSYKEWEALQGQLSTQQGRADAVLQLVARELGDSSFERVELPVRAPGVAVPMASLPAAAPPAYNFNSQMGFGQLISAASGGPEMVQAPWAVDGQAQLDAWSMQMQLGGGQGVGGFSGEGGLQQLAWPNAAALSNQLGLQQWGPQEGFFVEGPAAEEQGLVFEPCYFNRGLGAIGANRTSSHGSHSPSGAAAGSEAGPSSCTNVVSGPGVVAPEGSGPGALAGTQAGLFGADDVKVVGLPTASPGTGNEVQGSGSLEQTPLWSQGLYGAGIWGHQPLSGPMAFTPNTAFETL